MLENSLFYTVDCWHNINLWCKMVCAKSIKKIDFFKYSFS